MPDCCGKQGHFPADPDLLVIGAGSAGFSAAITAAQAGATVVLAGAGTIGGTCVNVGCVPSKTLIRATEAVHQARRADRFNGLHGAATITDWKALVRQKRQLVGELRQARYADLLPAYPNISYVEARARFTGQGIEVQLDAVPCRPKKIILATGAAPALPPIEGIQGIDALDSTAALDLDVLPASLLIIGGGVIGCELGQMFARAGVAVTICCRRRLLPEAEPEASAALGVRMREEGVIVHEGVSYRKIERRGNQVELQCRTEAGEQTLHAEQVLAAAGRRPNTGGLGLERAGIALTAGGGVAVDASLRSSHPDVYAAGDVTGRDLYVYMAAYGGKLAAGNALDGAARRYDNATMPAVVFTDPQLASVGLTEDQARASGFAVKTSTITLDQVPRFIAARDTHGLIKLVADGATDRLLGAAILAPEAGDSIQTVVMALRAGITTAELGAMIFPYLTAVEGIKLAALGFSRDVGTLSCCAG